MKFKWLLRAIVKWYQANWWITGPLSVACWQTWHTWGMWV